MFTAISNIWKVSDLRNRILFTLLMILVFRIGSYIPVPNVNAKVLADASATNPLFGMLNTFSGGALQNYSIFAMSITPYITASIIVQLLAMGVIPKFEEWQKEGEAGRKRLAQITRYGTVILGLIQAFGLTVTFSRTVSGLLVDTSWTSYALITITLTAGTAFLMWLGEQITDKGIGNGISIIIFAGIIAGVERGARQIYAGWFSNEGPLGMAFVKLGLLIVGIVLLIAAIVFIYQGVRRVPVQYAKRVVGRKQVGGQSTHIPLKVNASGVIPVIFASSLLTFPMTLAQFLPKSTVTDWIQANLAAGHPLYVSFEVLLIIFFTYFYTFIQINPVQLADGMKKNGGFIPGIRPGKPTEMFITRVMNRITLAGAIFLAAIAALPVIFMNVSGLNMYFGGTGLLIVVGVALETMKQVESQLLQRHYKGFIRNR
ncbi:preprotein translocase subunit SecY [Tumebacillus permanentifrigoris]|jgi:preprotein translocase subunit SecY|uniref:Protein translocase subunit SecY n=1 Tax=Tumebacillus permanentifrigoris TaxID=378543 RepID=A0A316D3X5_9BACL|nr:preprotein translocase subunit SecY [Tumebacillus permanentifrigoris]PWK05693.1 protein translocase subunit secY/sec61 alpha [Tumebacillus permanentifrigoris]